MFTLDMNRRAFVGAIAAVPLAGGQRNTDWIELFDGKSLNGWRPSEHKSSWKAVDGALVADGPRSHLFYDGPVHGGDFRNFELEVELTTNPECNSGIYFHAAYQESGFPEKGFEIQINNTAKGDGGYLERKKTGSLYGIRNMYKQLVPDEKPFQVNATVRGKNVQIRLNGELLVDYVEPTPPVIPEGGEKQRFLDHGTFALQCHNDGSRASYRRVRVRPLPDDLPAYTGPPPVVDDVYRAIINIGRHNAPMVDYHVLLNSDLTLDDALRKSRRDGIQYGITADASSLKSEQDVEQWLGPLERKPVFLALSASDGKWTRMMSRESAKRFDYILADNAVSRAQAQSNSDQQAFVDGMIAQVIKRVDEEPIDIYSHATFLPANMSAAAGDLWTEARRTKLIEAFARNKVAIELDTVNKLPSQKFIEQAKAAGCKFGFGTGNRTAAELKRCEYGLQMVQACKLDWQNLYVPGSWWPKAVERRWPSA